MRRPVPAAPAPPRRGSENVPDDIPDARDDDIIARQLREAAMQEDDPVLKEKLWAKGFFKIPKPNHRLTAQEALQLMVLAAFVV